MVLLKNAKKIQTKNQRQALKSNAINSSLVTYSI